MPKNLQYYLRKWKLIDPVLMAQTPTSAIYRVMYHGEESVLKLLTPIGVEDEGDSVLALQYYAGQGAVRLLAHDEQAHLLEYASGEELAEMVVRGDDDTATEIIADVLNNLHRPQSDTPLPQLQSLRERFESLFNRAKEDEASGLNSIYMKAAQVANHLLENPQNETVLHGDIQHHNIRLHPTRGWLAFDAKGVYGERIYDTSNALCNPSTAREQVHSETRWLRMSEILADKMGVDLQRLRAFSFSFACLSASWSDKPEGSEIQNWFLTVARLAESYVG